MRIRCPHCHNPLEVLEESSFKDISCPSCGSRFNLVGGDATTETHRQERRTVGHYDLLEQIGLGASGSVWKARDKKLDRVVAIKIPHRERRLEQHSEAFLREARAAAQLRSPNIVSLHEVGKQDDIVYIASDYVEGSTLREWLGGRPIPPRTAAQLCLKIARALHHAHEQGVIHRDIKPSNILMDPNNEPHVTDFGLARRESGEITITVDGAVLGTLFYMSPEQASGKSHEADNRSDIYSIGVLLYEMLAGEVPFRGEKRMVILQIQTEEPVRLRHRFAGIPRDLETITLKCLEKSPQRRYQTAAELASELERFLDHKPIVARPVGRLMRTTRWCRRNPVVASLSLLATLLLVAGTAISTYFAIKANVALTAFSNASAAASTNAENAVAARDRALSRLSENRKTIDAYVKSVTSSELDREDKIQLLRETVGHFERFVKHNGGLESAAIEVAKAFESLAFIHRELGDIDRELPMLERAIEVRRNIDEDYDSEENAQATISLCFQVGPRYARSGRHGDAIDAYETALQTQTKLTRTHSNEESDEALAKAHAGLRDSWLSLGSHQRALHHANRVIEFLERSTQATTSTQERQVDLCRALRMRYAALTVAGQHKKADQDLAQALELFRALDEDSLAAEGLFQLAITLRLKADQNDDSTRVVTEYERVRALLDRAITLNRRIEIEAYHQAFEVCELLTSTYDARGEIEKARELRAAALEASRRLESEAFSDVRETLGLLSYGGIERVERLVKVFSQLVARYPNAGRMKARLFNGHFVLASYHLEPFLAEDERKKKNPQKGFSSMEDAVRLGRDIMETRPFDDREQILWQLQQARLCEKMAEWANREERFPHAIAHLLEAIRLREDLARQRTELDSAVTKENFDWRRDHLEVFGIQDDTRKYDGDDVRLSPRNDERLRDTYWQLGRNYARAPDHESARTAFLQSNKLAAAGPRATREKAERDVALKIPAAESHEELKAIVSLGDRYLSEHRQSLALNRSYFAALMQLDGIEAAKQVFARRMVSDPSNALIERAQGDILMRHQAWDDAVSSFKRAAEVAPVEHGDSNSAATWQRRMSLVLRGTETLLPLESRWRWKHERSYSHALYRSFFLPEFDDKDWAEDIDHGFGYGGPVAVDIAEKVPRRPYMAFFRNKFRTTTPYRRICLTAEFDDGVVVFLDGHEVARWGVNPGDEYRVLRATSDKTFPEQRMCVPIDRPLEPGNHTIAIAVYNYQPTGDLRLAHVSLHGWPSGNAGLKDNADGLLERGIGWYSLHIDDLALRDLEAAISKRPEHAEAYRWLSDLYVRQGKANEALETLQNGIVRASDDPLLHRALGRLHKSEENWESASAALRTVVDLRGDIVDYRELGEALLASGNDDAHAAMWRELLDRHAIPANWIRRTLFACLSAEEAAGRSEQLLDLAYHADNDSLMSAALYWAGKYEAADAVQERYGDKDDEWFCLVVAMIKHRIGDQTSARQFTKTAYESFERHKDDPAWRYNHIHVLALRRRLLALDPTYANEFPVRSP